MKYKFSKSMHDAAKISTGTAIGQLFSIVSLPFITRLYGSEIMGIWTTIFAISIIICTISDCGLLQSIMVEKDDNIEVTFNVISMLIFIISLLSMVIVFFYCKKILGYSGNILLTTIIFSIIYAITYQFVQLNYTLLNRNGNYNILMKNPIINQVSAAVISVCLGFLGVKQYGYFIGITMGQFLTLLHMKKYLPYKFKLQNCYNIKKTFISHNNFVCYQMPVNITLQARDQIPNLLIGALFGNAILGYYSISQKLLNIPITFIGQALGRVFYQRCAQMKRQGIKIANFFYRNLKRALLIAAIPMVLFAAFGDIAITMFFGQEYAVGGIMVRIVVFRSFFAFVSASTRGIDIILDKQQYAMISSLSQTILISICIVITHLLSGDIVVCTIMMTISFIIIQISYFCVMFNVMKMPIINYLKSVLPILLSVLILALVLRYAFVLFTELTGWKIFEYFNQFMVRKI